MTTHSMIQDINGNIIANNVLDGYTTTATAAATTTLTVASAYRQFFTGSTTQTVLLPVTSTLVLGQSFSIVNNSSGAVTVQSSGANNIQVMASSTTAIYTCILTSGTTAASWSVTYITVGGGGSGIVSSGTAGQLTYYSSSGTTVGGGQIGNTKGTATNDNAAAGNVGELMSSVITGASAVSLTTNTAVAVTNLPLTAGDWDLWGNVGLVSASIASTFFLACINNAVATTDQSTYNSLSLSGIVAGNGISAPSIRVSLAAPVTYYLVAFATFAGTASACGGLYARRPR